MVIRLVFMLLGYVILYVVSFRKYKGRELFYISLLYFYITLILNLTIIPDCFVLKPTWKDLLLPIPPRDSLKPYYDFSLSREGSLIDIILNVLMMIPFGYLLGKVSKTNVFKVVLTTLFFSMFIEITQLLMSQFFINHRFFDITDIINNAIGGFIGYLFYKIGELLEKLL